MFKILIVEDEDIIREGLRYSVDWTTMNCVVAGEAANGEEGLEKIAQVKPDIVLLDINMPLKDGLDMLSECQNDHIFSTIIISGYEEFDYAKRAIEFGVIGYLLKPVENDELYKLMERAKQEVQERKKYHVMQQSVVTPHNMNLLHLNEWNETVSKSKLVKQMIAYIQNCYRDKISILDLVDELGFSATYLNREFKKSTNYSFNDFLNRYRIQKSIEYIAAGEDKISVIGTIVGFSNYQYFIKVFKKYTSFLPSDFSAYFKNN